MCEEISLCCHARMLPGSRIQIFPSSSLRHSHLWILNPHQSSAQERGSMAVPCGTAVCFQENSTVLPGEQCQHFTVSRSGTLPSPGKVRPAQKAFLAASCSTQLQMFPHHSTQCSKICIRISFGEEEILREPL